MPQWWCFFHGLSQMNLRCTRPRECWRSFCVSLRSTKCLAIISLMFNTRWSTKPIFSAFQVTWPSSPSELTKIIVYSFKACGLKRNQFLQVEETTICRFTHPTWQRKGINLKSCLARKTQNRFNMRFISESQMWPRFKTKSERCTENQLTIFKMTWSRIFRWNWKKKASDVWANALSFSENC